MTSSIQVSDQLNDAIQLYYLVDQDLKTIGSWSRPIDRRRLQQARGLFSQRFRQLAFHIDADPRLAAEPALRIEMKALFAELRASLIRHQDEWPPERAVNDLTGFRNSATEVQLRSDAFKRWCDLHIEPGFPAFERASD